MFYNRMMINRATDRTEMRGIIRKISFINKRKRATKKSILEQSYEEK